ncbi:MAG: hypothetical protein ACHQF2_00725 [Flavobacteriales bacterium]
MKKRAWFVFLVLVIFLPGLRAPEQLATHHFAIRIYPQGNFLVTTAIVTVQNKKVVKQEVLNRDQFVLMMSGVYRSKANPKSTDVFKEHGIYTCESIVDTLTNKLVSIKCPLLDDIWKVRYKLDIRKKNYFYGQNVPKEGWANTDFFPSKTQYEYLIKTYGADGCYEFIWGDNLFKFLKDAADTSWQNKYKALN